MEQNFSEQNLIALTKKTKVEISEFKRTRYICPRAKCVEKGWRNWKMFYECRIYKLCTQKIPMAKEKMTHVPAE